MTNMANCVSNDLDSNSPVVPLAFSDDNGADSIHLKSEIPSSHVESSTESMENGISSNIIDSALLCAMRDARERHGLLRLEQVMIDFIKEETSGYIEVGGFNNSIVYSSCGDIISGKQQSLENNGGGRQTSFQRCWLHRLADRFNIIRETNEQGMIRLVKVKESAIPTQLLIDLQPSDYHQEQPPSESVRGLSTKLSDTSIGNKPLPKMKIMKRSSSGLGGSSNSLKSEKGASKNSKSKNLSDKEKAYAEARARIFAESAAAAGGGGGETVPGDDTAVGGSEDTKLEATSPERTASSRSLPTFSPNVATTAVSSAAETEQDDGTARNKATYRNRQEEENDPDFYRLSSTTSASSSLHGYGVADAYGQAQQQQQQYGYNPQQQHFYPAGYTYPQQGYAVGGEIFYPAPPSTQTQKPGMMRRQDSTGSANSKTNVPNLDEFPSLGS